MKTSGPSLLAIAFSLLVSVGAYGQMGMRQPDISGFWNPTVGSGAAYEIQNDQTKNQIEIAVVGKESVDGKDGFWMEYAGVVPQPNGQGDAEFVSKVLMVLDGPNTEVRRMIMQMPGRPPMEMPMQMMQRGQNQQRQADVRKDAEDLGKESVTTPAGSFDCEHYKMKSGSDIWVSETVHPWGMVKMKNQTTEITLVKTITDAKDKITGEPQQFNPMQMAPH
jgi:hypothetical protein